ncbi:MAG: zinc metallopeptidase [Planctomycetes bacterium]|nr:zinc metallopeptidase [Planctomycetota bacterium]MBI3843593.1 zinc metallopeptidase [Planctomycetota bacterium]
MFFDPMYLLYMSPALILSLWATIKVQGAFAKYSKVQTRRRLTGAEVAKAILQRNGIADVSVEEVSGMLSDHYDPREKVLRLSPKVYREDSISSVAVAAHEVGHAIQHQQGYAPLALRSSLVPVANIGSNLAMPLFFIGMILHFTGLIWAGIVVFGAAVLFSLVTLPVEFNASARAMVQITEGGLIDPDEAQGARKMLNAAAMTYVAAALMAILQLLYLVTAARRRD